MTMLVLGSDLKVIFHICYFIYTHTVCVCVCLDVNLYFRWDLHAFSNKG